jgi:hypothetical protein
MEFFKKKEKTFYVFVCIYMCTSLWFWYRFWYIDDHKGQRAAIGAIGAQLCR